MPYQYGQNSFLPQEQHLLLILGLTGRSPHANGADDCGLKLASAAHVVKLGLVLDGAAEHVSSFLPLEKVGHHANGSHHCEISVLQEGDVADDPILGLVSAVVAPLVGREEAINVGDVQVFAEQTWYLCPGPQRVVGDDYW